MTALFKAERSFEEGWVMETLRLLKYACGMAVIAVALVGLITQFFFPLGGGEAVSIVAAVSGGGAVGLLKVFHCI